MLMAEEMSSSAWVLMDEDCDCGGPPPQFNLPPPPFPPNFPCELEMNCPNVLSISDAEYKKIGSFPTVTLLISCILISCVILLVVAGLVWKYVKLRKKRKGVTQTKDFDHGPSAMMNGNGVLYEDLAHARPRPPIAPPSIEMLDINHHPLASDGIMGNPKLDFSYFLNPPPIYEELPDHSDRNGPSEDEFAEDELSVIDVPVSHEGDTAAALQARYHAATAGRGNAAKPRAQSLTRKRGSRNGSSGGSCNGTTFKSQRSLDRRARNGSSGAGGKYNLGSATNPRGYTARHMGPGDNNNPGSMLILSNQNGMTMKIPPHLLAVLTESALCNEAGARPYEIIPTSMGGHVTLSGGNPTLLPNGVLLNHAGGAVMSNGTGIYPSSRSSGSSYGDGGSSSAGSARNNQQGKSIESSSFDSGIGPNFITSFINSPAYDQAILPPAYTLNTYEYTGDNGTGVINPVQYLQGQQHPSFRRLRMTPADRDHPLYSNHLLT